MRNGKVKFQEKNFKKNKKMKKKMKK